MDTRIDIKLLDRYLAGTCSPRERLEVERWIQQAPDRSLNKLRGSFKDMPLEAGDPHLTKVRVRERLSLDESKFGPTYRNSGAWYSPRSSFAHMARRYSLSASIAVVALAAILGIGLQTINSTSASPVREFVTGVGQRSTLQLPDGSTMLVGPQSRVRYTESFGRSNRTVELAGQALFTVIHSAGHPFIVRTTKSDTRVLGTSFSVREYESDSTAHIAVAEGKVEVHDHNSKNSVVLATGYEVEIGEVQNIPSVARRIENISATLAWTQGRLEYKNTPVSTVVADLKRLFAVDIRISSSVTSHQLVTGAFDNTMTPRGAVTMLALILGGDVKHNGTTFYITER